MPAHPEELAAIHAEFADPVVYTGAGLPGPTPITAIFNDEPAETFMGAGATARKVSFEVQIADLPDEPGKADTILHDGTLWRVIDVTRRRDIAAWALVVEKAA